MTKFIVIAVFLSLFSVWPFFKKGYFKSHDGEWMLIRFTAFHQSLTEGHFPVRMTKRLNNNYGYPVLNFLYPGPFYLAEIPKIFGLSYITSIKFVFVSTTIGSVLLMFWALSKNFPPLASLGGSIVYLFIPYRFVDLYVRGSLGENTAFFIAPLVLGSIFGIAKGSKIFLPVLSVFIALLLISHNIIAALYIIVFILISFTMLPKKLFFQSLIFIFLGLGISAFFTVPAIIDLQYVRLTQITVADTVGHLTNISKVISPSWGYGSNPNHSGGLSPQLGVVPIIVFFSCVVIQIANKKKNWLILLSTILFALTVLLILTISKPLWATIPQITIIQFPWRLLSIIVMLSAVLTAFVIEKFNNLWILAAVILLSLISTISYTKPVGYSYQPDDYYSTNEDTTTVKDEYLPRWVMQKPTERANRPLEQNEYISVLNEKLNGLKYQATIKANTETQLLYNTIYFPGYKAKVDGESVEIKYDNPKGLITLKLPEGMHEVIIYYSKTTVHLVSELISTVALSLTLILLYKIWRKPNF